MRPKTHTILLTAALLAFVSPPSPLAAQTITTELTRIGSQAFYYDAQDITYVSGGTGEAFGGSAQLLCIDYGVSAPSQGVTLTYEVVPAIDIFANTTGAERGFDYINWVFDNYFDEAFNIAPYYLNYRSQFQSVLYELVTDYNGTLASLSPSTGLIQNGLSEDYYIGILDDLVTSDPLIPIGYRSSEFQFAFLTNMSESSQNMLLFSPVPEPSGALLIGLAGALALLRRKRK